MFTFLTLLALPPQAFSTPRVQVQTSGSGHTLHCEAPRWFPRPTVHWMAYSEAGKCLPHAANTSYELNSENITLKVVSFLHDTTANATYTCVIENSIAKATGNIKVTGRDQQHPEAMGTGQSVCACALGAPAALPPLCWWLWERRGRQGPLLAFLCWIQNSRTLFGIFGR